MFVNDEDFAFVGSVFFNFGKPYICKGKAVHAKKRKAYCVRTSQKCSGRFLGGGGRIFSAKQVAGYFSKGRRTFL